MLRVNPVSRFLITNSAPGTGPLFSSVTRPESVAPETWARASPPLANPNTMAISTQAHFAYKDVEPLFDIIYPLARPHLPFVVPRSLKGVPRAKHSGQKNWQFNPGNLPVNKK